MKNLLNQHGRKFSAKIDEHPVMGKISVEGGYVFLCQDSMCRTQCNNTLGYDYSWSVLYGTPDELINNHVTNFKLI